MSTVTKRKPDFAAIKAAVRELRRETDAQARAAPERGPTDGEAEDLVNRFEEVSRLLRAMWRRAYKNAGAVPTRRRRQIARFVFDSLYGAPFLFAQLMLPCIACHEPVPTDHPTACPDCRRSFS